MAYQAGGIANQFCIDRANSPNLNIEIKQDQTPGRILSCHGFNFHSYNG